MKFTQCARVRLVDASFAEAPGPLARSSLHPPCSFPSFRDHSLMLLLPLMVNHHSDGLGILNGHQPCQLQVFPHHRSFGRLFARAPLPSLETSSVPFPSTFCSHSLLGDALRTAEGIFCARCLITKYQFHSCACQHHGTCY